MAEACRRPDLQIPDFLLDQGTKYIVSWTAQDNDAIATQRIDFSPDGHFPDRYSTLVSNIPASARSWEITIPDPGFAGSTSPVFPGGFDRCEWSGGLGRGAGTGSHREHHWHPNNYHRLERPDLHWRRAYSRYGLDRVGKFRDDHASGGPGF